MAASPEWKVYTPEGRYVGCLKYPSDAAAVVALYGPGATIRHGHEKRYTVWTEGEDGEAAESFDAVAVLALARLDEWRVGREIARRAR